MPLSEQQRKELLLSEGYNPEGFDLDETTGFIYKKEQTQPTLSAATYTPGSGEAFLTSAKNALGPLAGGAAAIAAAAPLNVKLGALGTAFAPETFGASYIPLGVALLAEGAAGALGGGKLQQFVEPKIRGENPQETQARLQKETALRQEFPKASFAGEVAPQLLLARPSPKMLGNALKGGANLLARAPVLAEQQRALANVVGGAALGAGGEISNQVLGDEPASLPRILGAAAAGGIISKPYVNPLNRALGFVHPELPPQIGSPEAVEFAKSGKQLREIPQELSKLQEANLKKEIARTPAPQQQYLGGEDFGRSLSPEYRRVLDRLGIPEVKAGEVPPPQKELFSLEEQQRTKLAPEIPDAGGKPVTQKEFLARKLEQTQQKIDAVKSEIETEKYRQAVSAQEQELAAQHQELEILKKAKVDQERLAQAAEASKENRPNVITPRDRAKLKELHYQAYAKARKEGGTPFNIKSIDYYEKMYPDFKAKYETGDTTPFEPIRQTGPSQGTRFQEEGAGLGEAETEVGTHSQSKATLENQLKEGGVSPFPTTGLLKIIQSVGNKRNVRLKFGRPGELINERGEPVKGLIDTVRDGVKALVAKINPRIASLDSLGHEVFHGFLADLEKSSSKIESSIPARLYKLIESLPEYQTALSENPKLTPHEFATENVGYDIVRRVFNADKSHGTWRGWWHDFTSALKVRWDRATTQDYVNLLSNKFLNDPSYFETRGFTPKTTGEQPNENNTKIIFPEVSRAEEGSAESQKSGGEESAGKEPNPSGEAEGAGGQEGRTLRYQDESEGLNAAEIRKAEGQVNRPRPSSAGGKEVGGDTLQHDQETGRTDVASREKEKQNLIEKLRSKEKNERDIFALRGPQIILEDFPSLNKPINAQQLWNRLRNKLTPAELDVYIKAGVDKAIVEKGQISPREAATVMQESGPQVKVHSYGMEGKVSEAKREYDRMTHEWLDQLDGGSKSAVLRAAQLMYEGNSSSAQKELNTLSARNYEKAEQYIKLSAKLNNELGQRDTSPRATSAYETVSAFDTKEPMPEWTTSKEGRNVQRVDVVIPQKYDPAKEGYKAHESERGTLWQPDNLHENLPNTLGWAMIQYKTGPKGEKIAVIVEAQSRWGQERRNQKQQYPEAQTEQETRELRGNRYYAPDHPLLRDYNRLILKAAIDQARKEGADHIVISDAETAMMTEGHDINASSEMSARYKTEEEAKQVAKQYTEMQPDNRYEPLQIGKHWVLKQIKKPQQESGMRLNYDKVLPKIAEELTGSKGERVSLGEHKNAFESSYPILELEPREDGGFTDISKEVITPRQNLIFRNPDGTPKTDVSGTMYPIKQTEKMFSLYEKDRPENVSKRFYQEEKEGLKVDPLIESYRKDLASRKDYRDIVVENQPKIGHGVKTPVEGYYSSGEQKAFSKPERPEVALHEVIHKLNDKNKTLLGIKIKTYADKFNAEVDNEEFPAPAIQTLARALAEIHPIYNHHNIELGNLKKLPTYKSYEIFRAVDEGLASLAGFQNNRIDIKTRIRESLNTILGKDFVDFIENGTKAPELYPRYKRLDSTTKEIDQIYANHQKLAEEFDSKYRTPAFAEDAKTYIDAPPEELARFAQTIEEGLKRIQQLKEEDPGYYYQNLSQGLNSKDIASSIDMVRRGKAFQKESLLESAVRDITSGRLPLLGSDIDKFEVRAGKNGKILAPALRESFAKERQNLGKYWAPIQDEITKLNTKEQDQLYATMLAEKRTQQPLRDSLPDKLKASYDVIRESLKQKQLDQIEANQPVAEISKSGKIKYRLPKVNPFYVPEIVGRKQLETLLNNPESDGAKYLKSEFINLYTQKYEFTPEAAKSLLNDVLASYGGALKGDSTHFNAVRKAEGIGLPDTWLESDFDRSLERYWRRVSKDRAWFDAVESNPNAAHILGMTKDAWNEPIKPTESGIYPISGNPNLQNVLNIIQQRNLKLNPKLDAISRIASNLILGPTTAINDFISGPILMSKFVPGVEHLPGFFGAFKNISSAIESARGTGNIKSKLADYQEIFTSSTELTDKLNKLSNFITKFTGRDLGEKMSRGLTQALGEYLIPIHKRLAESGNAESRRLLEHIANGPGWKDLSTAELGTRLSELAQGTYDPRGLPSWVLDSPVAPLFKLSKWSIEQTNNFFKHVVLPAKNGNFNPLIYSLFGSVIGGEIIREVRERLGGKKLQIPTLEELGKSEKGFTGNVPATTYNLMAAAAFSGVAGFAGDIAKSVMDISNKNLPQGFNYPLAEIIGNSATKIGHAAQAIIDGEDPAQVSSQFMVDLLKSNTQVARLAINNWNRWTEDQQYKDANARRDLRVFRIINELPYSAQEAAGGNPYENLNVKKFKRTTDLREAQQLLPEIIKEKIEENRGNPAGLRRALGGLKINSLQTFPAPERNPQEFIKYRKYLGDVYGPEESSVRASDYFKRKSLNKFKSEYVP